MREPIWGIARWSSYAQRDRDGKLMGLWATMPDVMLAKCAEAQALRAAFPAELSGVYVEEEVAAVQDVPPPEPPEPSARGKQLAERARQLPPAYRDALKSWCMAEHIGKFETQPDDVLDTIEAKITEYEAQVAEMVAEGDA
jgi:hypothetical protein